MSNANYTEADIFNTCVLSAANTKIIVKYKTKGR